MSQIFGIKINICIGSLKVNRCPECIILSSKRAALTNARLTIPDPRAEVEKLLKPGTPVSVSYGYRGEIPGEFRGTITGWRPSEETADQTVVYAAGPELPALTNTIVESWYEEPARVLAKRILQASGLKTGNIDIPDHIIPRMTLSGTSTRQGIIKLMHSLEKGFGMDLSNYMLRMENGALTLNNKAPEKPEAWIATGKGLITNKTFNNKTFAKEVETFLKPGMRAGKTFYLKDIKRGINSDFSADEVVHSIRPKEIRTFIKYGGKYDCLQC